jgi:hypothetical protein
MSANKWYVGLAVLAVSAAAGAFAETAAYIYGMVGVFSGDYESDGQTFEKLIGFYDYPGPEPWGYNDDDLTAAGFAVSPFGFGLKDDNWRASFVSIWSRRAIGPRIGVEAPADDRQFNNATLSATGGYIFNRGYFEGTMMKPYFGAFWRGHWCKAENVENGVIANGFGPDVGIVMDFDLNRSFALITFGYQYKVYTLTGPKVDNPTNNGASRPEPPHYNYTYVPQDEVPSGGSSFYVSTRSSLQFHRRVGAEVEVRYDADMGDSFVNGLTFAAGPSVWL